MILVLNYHKKIDNDVQKSQDANVQMICNNLNTP